MLNLLETPSAAPVYRRWLVVTVLATCAIATNACSADCTDTLTCPSQEASTSSSTVATGAGGGAGTSCVFDESAFETGCGFGP